MSQSVSTTSSPLSTANSPASCTDSNIYSLHSSLNSNPLPENYTHTQARMHARTHARVYFKVKHQVFKLHLSNVTFFNWTVLYIIFLEWILKVRGRAVIKLTPALTNNCSSCNSNEAKACWGEAFQLRRGQLAWLDGFQQLFRWKEANQDRSLLWLFAERVGGFSRIPSQQEGSKQTGDTVLSDHNYRRMIKTLFLVQRGGRVHPVSLS